MNKSEFTIKTSDLKMAFKSISEATSKRSTLPILSHGLFVAKKNRLTIRTTDLDIDVEVECGIDGDSVFTFCAPFGKIVKSLDYFGDEAVFQLSKTLVVTSENLKIELPVLSPDEFPPTAQIDGRKILFDSKWLRAALRKTIKTVCGSHEGRYMLTGIHFCKNVVESTNGKCLTRMAHSVEIDGEFIIPELSCKALVSLLSDFNGEVVCTVSDNRAWFEFSKITFGTRLIEGLFPNTQQVIPDGHRIEFLVTPELLTCVESVIDMRGDCDKITLEIDGAELTCFAAFEIQSSQNKCKIEPKGGNIKIAINADYLIEGIKNCSDSEASIYMTDELSPLMIKNKDTTVVIILMRL